MGWRTLVVVGCALPVLLAGCIGGAAPLGGLKEPMAGTSFVDAESDATSWRVSVSGNFHIPSGTRFEVSADNRTCMTRGLVDVSGNATLACTDLRDETHRHDVLVQDRNDDGRLGTGDLIEIRRSAGAPNGTLEGPHRLVLSLHRELPLFALQQDFRAGPTGKLQVELLS